MSIPQQIIMKQDPKSIAAESIRTLRTNLQFVLNQSDVHILLITSSQSGEGKSTVAANLAVSMANTGKKVLLVDADLRSPALHSLFGLPVSPGFSDVIEGGIGLEQAAKVTDIKGMHLLTAGTGALSPADLLHWPGTVKFLEISKTLFDIVLLDSPPVLNVADALILANQVDGVVLVVATGETPRDTVIRAKDQLEKANTKLLGVVLNGVEG